MRKDKIEKKKTEKKKKYERGETKEEEQSEHPKEGSLVMLGLTYRMVACPWKGAIISSLNTVLPANCFQP